MDVHTFAAYGVFWAFLWTLAWGGVEVTARLQTQPASTRELLRTNLQVAATIFSTLALLFAAWATFLP